MYPKNKRSWTMEGQAHPHPHAHGMPTARPRHILPRVESLLRYYVLSEIKSRTTFFELRTWRQRIVRVYVCVCAWVCVRVSVSQMTESV